MIKKQIKTVIFIILLLLAFFITSGCEKEDPNCLKYETEITVMPMYNAVTKTTMLQPVSKNVCVEWKEN